MSRLFDLDMQLLVDTALLALAVFVLFTALSYLLFNPVRKVLKNREERIKSMKEDAEKENIQALEYKSEYQARLKDVNREAELILSEARKKGLNAESKIIADANEEADRIIARANVEAALEKRRAKDELKEELIEIASMMAGKVVAVSIDTTIQDALIDETLKEIGDETWLS